MDAHSFYVGVTHLALERLTVVDDELPPDVVALLHDRLHSFEAVEALIVMHAEPRTRHLSDIAGAVGADREVIRGALEELARGGFVVREPDAQWRYAPVDAATASAVGGLVRAYRSARLDVMRRMTENAMERIRSSAANAFADAFRFGKGRRDG